jgi:hypothetical protein
MDRDTDRLPKLHHRLIEAAGLVVREERSQHGLQAVPHGRRAEVSYLPRPAGRDAQPVRFQRHRGRVKGEARDCAGNVRADPGQRLQLRNRGREDPAELVTHLPGRRVEVAGARVVAGPLPRLQHVTDLRLGERFDRGKPRQESLEVRPRLGHAGLLQ